jgi:hypothetical protein
MEAPEGHRAKDRGVYTYPAHIAHVQALIALIAESKVNRGVLTDTLAEEHFFLSPDAKLMPIFARRFVVCNEDLQSSAVVSIWDSKDAIVYGRWRQEYLEREFLGVTPDWAR